MSIVQVYYCIGIKIKIKSPTLSSLSTTIGVIEILVSFIFENTEILLFQSRLLRRLKHKTWDGVEQNLCNFKNYTKYDVATIMDTPKEFDLESNSVSMEGKNNMNDNNVG